MIDFTPRRLACKVSKNYAVEKLAAATLTLLQLGAGVLGGVEAVVHATRQYLLVLPTDGGIAKLYFKNDALRRDCMM